MSQVWKANTLCDTTSITRKSTLQIISNFVQLGWREKKTPCILIKAMYHKTLHMAITTIKRKCIRVHLDVAWYSDTQTQLYWAVKFLFCQKNLSARRLELQPKIIHKKTHEMLIDFNDWCKDNWNVRNEEV